MRSVGSMFKFFQERGGPDTEHRGTLHWPGTAEGFPFRGEQVPLTKQHETEQIGHALDYRSQLFRLWVAEEKAAFDAVMDRIVNGWYMQHRRTDKDVPGQIAPAVWLEWVQIYGELAQGKHPGNVTNDENTVLTLPGSHAAQPKQPSLVPTPQQLRRLLAKQTG